MTDIVTQLRNMSICEGVSGLRIEAADEIERLRKQLFAPSISWDGFLVSGMPKSIDEVSRLIDIAREVKSSEK